MHRQGNNIEMIWWLGYIKCSLHIVFHILVILKTLHRNALLAKIKIYVQSCLLKCFIVCISLAILFENSQGKVARLFLFLIYVSNMSCPFRSSVCAISRSSKNALYATSCSNAEHLPGHLNTITDHESWSIWDRCDSMLNQRIFQRIREKMRLQEVYLFASCLTKQLPQFYSWRADPEAQAHA